MLRKLKSKTRLVAAELLDRWLAALQSTPLAQPGRSLQLSELEERILMSAAPLAQITQMVESASLIEPVVPDQSANAALLDYPPSLDGQTEAALALGLSRGQTLRLVVVPQAMRVILPPMTSQYLNLTKNSSLAAAIAYPDLVLVFAGTVLMQTGQAVEVIAITMLVYLTISLLISFAMNRYSRAIALVER